MPKNFDIVGFIIDFESGEISDERIVEAFQHMINDGTVWNLQGMYGRTATDLIDRGFCMPRDEWTPQEAVENYKEYVAQE